MNSNYYILLNDLICQLEDEYSQLRSTYVLHADDYQASIMALCFCSNKDPDGLIEIHQEVQSYYYKHFKDRSLMLWYCRYLTTVEYILSVISALTGLPNLYIFRNKMATAKAKELLSKYSNDNTGSGR